jgi:lysophospholipase L1-like esterase
VGKHVGVSQILQATKVVAPAVEVRAFPTVTQLVAMGDSYSCGEGVGVTVHLAHTWVGVVAHALGVRLELIAGRGANVAEVRREQLPIALAQRVPLVTLLVGLNDVSRSRWSPERVAADLVATVDALRDAGSVVLLGRLHDPSLLLPLPRPVRSRLRRRLDIVNAAVDATRGPGVVVFDLANVPELRERSGWAVDRVHPSIVGHRGIAATALDALANAGIQAVRPLGTASTIPGPGQLAQLRWLTLYGAPYLVRKAFKTSTTVVLDPHPGAGSRRRQ